MNYIMNLSTPIVMYDNQCYLCIKFAKIVNFLARGKISLVGHYTIMGERIRKEILDSSALEMFWFIDDYTAYGGRAALIPLFKSFFSTANKKFEESSSPEMCDLSCKNVKAVFLRSTSLLSNSKKIKIK